MPAGRFRARDGRPFKAGHWVLDAAAAERVIALAATRQTPFVIDYEHQTLHAPETGQPAPAAAWFTQLEWRENDGLYAVDVEWTDRARALIEADEYRYLSPVFHFDPTTGAVRELLMAAVTNNPAIDGIADLAAARYLATTEEESAVDEKTLELLGLSKDASDEDIHTAIAALRTSADKVESLESDLAAARTATTEKPDPAKYVPVSAVNQLTQELAALRSDVQGKEVDALITTGLEDGRLLKDMEDWARELGQKDVAALRTFLSKAQPVAALTSQQSGGRSPGEGDSKLSDIEMAVCRQLGITEKEYIESKESEK